jgi:hypothetical protein
MIKQIKTTNKSLIFLKSSVLAMGIVFIVLVVMLIFVKQRKVDAINQLPKGFVLDSFDNSALPAGFVANKPGQELKTLEKKKILMDKLEIGNNCQKLLQLKIAGEVQEIKLQGNNIIILTKLNPTTKKQEIIKIDSNCVAVINKIELSQ